MSEHVMRVTAVIQETAESDLEVENMVVTCPQDESCATWFKCKVPGCIQPQDAWEAETQTHIAHGVEHRYIDYEWYARPDHHVCGVTYVTEWEGMEDEVRAHGIGDYTFDLSWDGYHWVASRFTKVQEAAT